MRYHLALPEGWSSGRTWAVVVVIPDASREFRANLEAFVAARGGQPFILVAPVSTNYQRRGLDDATFSPATARATLPIQPLRCGAPRREAATAVHFSDPQTARALADARAHGFAPRDVRIVAGAGHGPLAQAVLAWCDSLTHE